MFDYLDYDPFEEDRIELFNDMRQHDAHCITRGWHQNNLRLIAAGKQPNPAPVL